MRILIDGVSGFVAPYVANALCDLGHQVYGLERYVTGRTAYKTEAKYNRVFADLNDHAAVKQLIKLLQPEAVFHLAALSPVAFSYDNFDNVNQTNYLATINLAEACHREIGDFKRFLFASTSETYGNQNIFPIKETAVQYPNSPYAVSKSACELYLKYMRDAYGFPVTIAKPFNSYGRLGTTHFVVERIISQMLQDKSEICLGDPAPIRDYLYVSDHVNGYLSAFAQPIQSLGETFNFATGKGVTVKELVCLIAEKIDWNGTVRYGTIPRRPLDIDCLIGSYSKAFGLLGWKPQVTLSEGLDRTIEALRKT